MKKCLTLVATILFLCALAPGAMTVEINDKVIAIVNNDVITMSDLINEGGEDVTGDPNRVLPNGKTVAEARDIALEQIIMRKILDQTVEVLVEERHKGKWRGRTRTNKLVFFDVGQEDWTGHLVPVRITRTGPWAMQGTIE